MLGIVVAMQNEADVLLKQSVIRSQETSLGKTLIRASFRSIEYLLAISGVGKVNAAAATMLVLSQGATHILNFGVAGGIAPDKKIGCVFQIEKAAEADFDLSAINHTAVGTHNEREQPFFFLQCRANAFEKGIVASADRFVCDPDELPAVSQLGASICEMEGAAIAHVAWSANVPCSMFKAISDNANETSVRDYSRNCQTALDNLGSRMQEIFTEVFYE